MQTRVNVDLAADITLPFDAEGRDTNPAVFALVCLIGEIFALRTQYYFFIHNSRTDQEAALSCAKGSVYLEQAGRTKDLTCLLGAFEESRVLII
jgi:hypothetical protein